MLVEQAEHGVTSQATAESLGTLWAALCPGDRHEEAVTWLRKAIKLHMGVGTATHWFLLASGHQALDQRDKAKKSW
jgi:hypothetical protein